MSRERTCPVAHTAKGFALLRQKDYSAFSRMAARHRPEVAVTIGQNVAPAKSTRLYLDVRQEPPGAQRLRRDRAATAVSFRATRMSRERTCPAAHTAKWLALHQLFCSGYYSLAEPKRAKLDNSDGRQAPCGGRCNRSTKFCHGKMRGRPRRVSLDVRDWRLLLQSRHEGVAAQ